MKINCRPHKIRFSKNQSRFCWILNEHAIRTESNVSDTVAIELRVQCKTFKLFELIPCTALLALSEQFSAIFSYDSSAHQFSVRGPESGEVIAFVRQCWRSIIMIDRPCEILSQCNIRTKLKPIVAPLNLLHSKKRIVTVQIRIKIIFYHHRKITNDSWFELSTQMPFVGHTAATLASTIFAYSSTQKCHGRRKINANDARSVCATQILSAKKLSPILFSLKQENFFVKCWHKTRGSEATHCVCVCGVRVAICMRSSAQHFALDGIGLHCIHSLHSLFGHFKRCGALNPCDRNGMQPISARFDSLLRLVDGSELRCDRNRIVRTHAVINEWDFVSFHGDDDGYQWTMFTNWHRSHFSTRIYHHRGRQISLMRLWRFS